MKSAVETLSPTRAKITVEVPFEELKPSLDAAYQSIAKQVNIPGFRKGKVPPPVIDRQVGRGAVLDQAINDALPQLYVQALQENDLQPLAQPEIDVTKLEDNTLFEFTAEVDVRPTIEVPAYDGLSVQVDDLAVSDEDVAEQVEALRERFATLKDVERAAADGDLVTIDLEATTPDGEAIEGGQVSDYSYKVGSGDMLEGIDDALRGLSAGEEATFTSQLVGGDLAGQDVSVTVKVSAVKEQELPELDDDFAQTASEFDTVEELRADVTTRLERGKRLEQAAAARDAVLEQLLDGAEVPLPETLVTEELAARRSEIEQQLAYAGMTMEAYLDSEEQTIDEFEAELEKRVRDAVASQFLLDEIAKSQEIGVEQDELQAHLMRRAQQSGQNPEEFIKHMLEHNHIPEMVSEVVRGKALASIVESATVTDESGNVVDLKNLRPDGSLGEPAADEAEPEVEPTEEPAAEPAAEASAEAGEPAADAEGDSQES
ncbi:trigger factor [Nocardioides aurantiacus]|uniref:trigger factor n=1 Tax=Nocardioides aurantiacus TaxID=86796 RepID=UPI00403F996E